MKLQWDGTLVIKEMEILWLLMEKIFQLFIKDYMLKIKLLEIWLMMPLIQNEKSLQ